MKIAILADPIDGQYAGIHIYTVELIKALLQYDQKNEYILIRQKKGNEFPGIKQVVIPNLPVYTGFQVLRFFVIFPFLLRWLKVDAVVEPAHFGPFNLPKHIKRITMIHDLTPINYPEYHRYHSQMLQRIFLKGILKKADLILTNSDNTSRDTIAYFPGAANKIKRIYLGKEDLFKPAYNPETQESHQLKKPYYLYTGTIEPRKNLMVLLKAFELFKTSVKASVKLRIVGKKGWKSQPVIEALNKHAFREDIEVSGYVEREELPVLYSNALALVYPSTYEGFGLPVLEAMSCGTPCIISRSSSLPEVGGDAARYFDPSNSDELNSIMMEVFKNKNLRKTMSEASLVQATKFSWKAHAIEFIKAIESLA